MGKNEICSECVHNVHLLKRSWQEAKKKSTNYQYYSNLFAVVLLLGSQAPPCLNTLPHTSTLQQSVVLRSWRNPYASVCQANCQAVQALPGAARRKMCWYMLIHMLVCDTEICWGFEDSRSGWNVLRWSVQNFLFWNVSFDSAQQQVPESMICINLPYGRRVLSLAISDLLLLVACTSPNCLSMHMV